MIIKPVRIGIENLIVKRTGKRPLGAQKRASGLGKKPRKREREKRLLRQEREKERICQF